MILVILLLYTEDTICFIELQYIFIVFRYIFIDNQEPGYLQMLMQFLRFPLANPAHKGYTVYSPQETKIYRGPAETNRQNRKEVFIMEQRSVATCVILSIVTCGIYAIYWMYTIAVGFDEAQTQDRVGTTPGVTILLMILTCGIYGFYCYYIWGRATAEIATRYGQRSEDKSILYLILAIVGLSLVNDALIQSDFNLWLSSGQYGGPPPPQYPPQQPPPPPGY